MSKKLQFVKQEQPRFIQQFKKKAGLVNEPTIDDKKQQLGEAEDLPEKDDEKPVVVVLKEGDLTAEEADKVADGEVEGGKILFRKPELKREAKGLSASSKKKPKLDTAHPEGEKKPGKSKSKKSSKQKSPSLLSFNEDEEDGEFD